jgi:DNA-binding transcriptional regulator of glucitol operon
MSLASALLAVLAILFVGQTLMAWWGGTSDERGPGDDL